MVGPQGNLDTCLKLMVQTEQPGRHGAPPAPRAPWSVWSSPSHTVGPWAPGLCAGGGAAGWASLHQRLGIGRCYFLGPYFLLKCHTFALYVTQHVLGMAQAALSSPLSPTFPRAGPLSLGAAFWWHPEPLALSFLSWRKQGCPSPASTARWPRWSRVHKVLVACVIRGRL